MIFIGGDLYTFFDSMLYNGAELASMDMVVVTFNYRLGPFGILKFTLEPFFTIK